MTPQDTLFQFLNARQEDLLAFARDLVRTPSPNPPGDERAVAARVAEELQRLGLPAAAIIAKQPHRPNMLLRLSGSKPGPSLLLNGHLDTKPPGALSEWGADPFDPLVRAGKLHGLGSTDMKGAVAAMVYAVGALARVAHSFGGEVQLLLTADEEAGSAFGAKFIAASGRLRADAALIGEPVGIRRELEFMDFDSRGLACFRIQVHGDPMHSSLSDEFHAVNASVKAAGLLAALDREFKMPGATLNAGVTLQGGVYFGVVPGRAEFGCDLRVPVGTSEKDVRDALEKWLVAHKQSDPQLRAELIWESPPSIWIEPVHFPARHPLAVSLRDACAAVLGKAPPAGCFPAATDAPWFVAAGIPTIPAFGPGMLPLAHSPNERVEVSSIFVCARIYALAAWDYLQSGAQSDPVSLNLA